MEKYTVADFFCGAGGFSEGFRQAGFDIVFAMDNWEPARKTHHLNHPEAQQPADGDILSIDVEKIDDLVPDTEIIIGSPPCVNFSSSNKAGKADKTKGIQLITKYLQIIAIKKHKPNSKLKYWLMENVPNSRRYLWSKYSFKELGINNRQLRKLSIEKNENDIAIEIDTSESRIYNSVYYGVPQKRERFVTGEFPEPDKLTEIESTWITLGEVLDAFRAFGKIKDPLYNLEVVDELVTDAFYPTEIPPFEWEEAKVKKQQARYYGKMSFPENEKCPARTIMATRSIVAREAMIFSNGKPQVFRSPTIREAASIMSFPITYLFDGRDEAIKYKLVGNAVCPRMSYCFAKKIMEISGISVIPRPKQTAEVPNNFNNLNKNPPRPKKPRPKPSQSNFAEIIPDLKQKNFRVELDNNFPKLNNGEIRWRASIHHATGKNNMKSAFPKIDEVERILSQSKYGKELKRYKQSIRKILKKIPNDATKFQQQFCIPENDKRYLTPRKMLQKIKEIVDVHFPEKKFKEVILSNISDFKK